MTARRAARHGLEGRVGVMGKAAGKLEQTPRQAKGLEGLPHRFGVAHLFAGAPPLAQDQKVERLKKEHLAEPGQRRRPQGVGAPQVRGFVRQDGAHLRGRQPR